MAFIVTVIQLKSLYPKMLYSVLGFAFQNLLFIITV